MSDSEVLRIIEASRIVRAGSSASARIGDVVETSSFARRARALINWWKNEGARHRWRATGIVLLTAGSVHLLWSAGNRAPGWIALVVPLWAITAGATLLIVSLVATQKETS